MITVEHVRLAATGPRGFCVRGMRQWFALHNLDFDHFVRHGYPLSVAEAIDDKFARQIVAVAREEHERGEK